MKNVKKLPTKQLEKFSTIFTQLGLVLVLFIVYLAIEHETEEKKLSEVNYEITKKVFVDPDQDIVFVKEKQPKPKVNPSKEVFIIDEPIERGDNLIKETIIDDPIDEPIEVDVNKIIELDEPPKDLEPDNVPFISIEEAPVFKGCEGLSKSENKKCFDKQMNKFIQRNFNTSLANELGLRSGKHKIFIQFIIDKNGEVVDIKIRAPHPKLKSETLGTIQKLPKFKPGRQNNKFVKVKYTLPITFQVD
ncbi:energy transducer TonB [Polaribacter sp.]|uniref:energy transducer TonB n=1 Tax=Polaribacter sp. TaxID=1920175 RepID=UPI003F69D006